MWIPVKFPNDYHVFVSVSLPKTILNRFLEKYDMKVIRFKTFKPLIDNKGVAKFFNLSRSPPTACRLNRLS